MLYMFYQKSAVGSPSVYILKDQIPHTGIFHAKAPFCHTCKIIRFDHFQLFLQGLVIFQPYLIDAAVSLPLCVILFCRGIPFSLRPGC